MPQLEIRTLALQMEGERNPARAGRKRSSLIFRWSLKGAGVGEGDSGYIRPCPSLERATTLPSPSLSVLRMRRKEDVLLPAVL